MSFIMSFRKISLMSHNIRPIQIFKRSFNISITSHTISFCSLAFKIFALTASLEIIPKVFLHTAASGLLCRSFTITC